MKLHQLPETIAKELNVYCPSGQFQVRVVWNYVLMKRSIINLTGTEMHKEDRRFLGKVLRSFERRNAIKPLV